MNNITHEDLVDMLFREMQSANNLIGTLECTGFMSMERWNFMLKYISELSEIQNVTSVLSKSRIMLDNALRISC